MKGVKRANTENVTVESRNQGRSTASRYNINLRLSWRSSHVTSIRARLKTNLFCRVGRYITLMIVPQAALWRDI